MRFETQLDTLVFAILIAGFMHLIGAAIAKWGAKDYDNHDPRAWEAHQEGFRARANAAQQNCFEAFPFFAVGVMLASLGGADGDVIETVGWFFVVMRAIYIACYVTDKATLRSVFWGLGYAAVIYLYVLALY
jgi:uncharacterized MAPEG superfamily protein